MEESMGPMEAKCEAKESSNTELNRLRKMASQPGAMYAGVPLNGKRCAEVVGELPPQYAGDRLVPDMEVLAAMGYTEAEANAFLAHADRTTGLNLDSTAPGVWPNVEGLGDEFNIHDRLREYKAAAKESPGAWHPDSENGKCYKAAEKADLQWEDYDPSAYRKRKEKSSMHFMAKQALNLVDEVKEDIKSYQRAEEMCGEPAYEALLAEVAKRFRGLKLSWKGRRLHVNDVPTKIGGEKVSWAFRELRSLGSEEKVRHIVADLIASKLSEVFEKDTRNIW